jgi:hypothetical protein
MAAAARHYAVLAVILAAALAIRVALAATNGLWLDEGLTVALAAWPARDLLALPVDPNPATIYLLQKLLPPDAPLLAIRAFAIAAGTASVALAYALGRLAFGRGAGLLAAALLAVWTVHVDYSLEARAYILLFLSTLAASTGVAAYAREDRPRLARAGLALFAAGNVAAWYAHPTAAFWIAASSLILAGVALARRTPRAAIEAASAFAAMALAALPSLPRLVAQQAQGVDFTWLAQAAPREALRQAADVMGPMGLWTNPIASGGDLQRLAILAAVALVAAWAAWPRRREIARLLAARPWAAALIAAYLLMPLAVWATGLVATPIFMRRTILFAIPGALLVLALAAAGRRIPASSSSPSSRSPPSSTAACGRRRTGAAPPPTSPPTSARATRWPSASTAPIRPCATTPKRPCPSPCWSTTATAWCASRPPWGPTRPGTGPMSPPSRPPPSPAAAMTSPPAPRPAGPPPSPSPPAPRSGWPRPTAARPGARCTPPSPPSTPPRTSPGPSGPRPPAPPPPSASPATPPPAPSPSPSKPSGHSAAPSPPPLGYRIHTSGHSALRAAPCLAAWK